MNEDQTKGLVLVPVEPRVAEPEAAEIRNCFQDALNRHGYGFQYAVIKKAAELIRTLPLKFEQHCPLSQRTTRCKKIAILFTDVADQMPKVAFTNTIASFTRIA